MKNETFFLFVLHSHPTNSDVLKDIHDCSLNVHDNLLNMCDFTHYYGNFTEQYAQGDFC